MGTALLRLKLHTGDDDPVVLCDALHALITLDPDSGIELAGRWLVDASRERWEIAALALGQSRNLSALEILVDAFERAVVVEERRTVLIAIGTLRLEEAREYLLNLLVSGHGPDALVALTPFRFDPSTMERALRRAPAPLHAAVRTRLGPDTA